VVAEVPVDGSVAKKPGPPPVSPADRPFSAIGIGHENAKAFDAVPPISADF